MISNVRKRKLVTDMVEAGTYTNKQIIDAVGVTNRFVNKIKQEKRGAPSVVNQVYTEKQKKKHIRQFNTHRAEGYSIKEAAALCGVNPNTIYRWAKEAEGLKK